MMWARAPIHEERRIRDFCNWEYGLSETAASLSAKLGVDRRLCRRILDTLVNEGLVQRREFTDIDPIYVRYPIR